MVFLKGTAYHVAADQAGKGRVFSDVDILVPEDKLLEVERALISAGWMTNTLNSYDQKYYRQWMHEIPPLRHLKRQTSIDVHHNILPKTTRFCPDANKLLVNIVKISEKECLGFSARRQGVAQRYAFVSRGGVCKGFPGLVGSGFIAERILNTGKFLGRNYCNVPKNLSNKSPYIMRSDILI